MSFRDRRPLRQIGGLWAYFRQALWGFWWRATLDRRLRAEKLATAELEYKIRNAELLRSLHRLGIEIKKGLR